MLGTGLGGLADHLEDSSSISYQELPYFPHSTVESHPGNLIWGLLAGKKVLVLQGRFHLYEGYTARQIAFPIRVLAALGIKTLIVSNAAGGLDPIFEPGDVMLITDQINYTGENPLVGPHLESWGPRFPDMSRVYDRRLCALAKEVAEEQKIPLRNGVYVGLKGPTLETPAETRFLIRMGAQAVGMSTIMEVITAVQAGMRLLGFSVITNVNRPDCMEPITMESVIETAQKAEPKFMALVEGVISKDVLTRKSWKRIISHRPTRTNAEQNLFPGPQQRRGQANKPLPTDRLGFKCLRGLTGRGKTKSSCHPVL